MHVESKQKEEIIIKITFFGTGHGVPDVGRKYSCIMFEVAGNRYFIDMGMVVDDQLIQRNIDFNTIKGVFITHMHGDHTHGLPAFLNLADWYFKAYSPKVLLPREDAIGALEGWINSNRTDRTDFFPLKANLGSYSAGEIFNDGVISVHAVGNNHIADSYSFLVKAEGRNIIFTGDLRNPKIDFPIEFLKEKIDLLVCEGAHFPVEEYVPVLQDRDIENICFVHYLQSRVDNINSLAEKINSNIRIAMDNTEIVL